MLLLRLKDLAAGVLAVVLASVVLLVKAEALEGDGPSLTGRYAGFALSAGAVASLVEENGRVLGQFTDREGRVYQLNGQRVGDSAQGGLVRDGVASFFMLERRPLGIQFMRIPAGADGAPDMAAAVQAAMAREGVDVETLLGQPERVDEGPGPKRIYLGALTGIDLAESYLALEPRTRELMRLFDHVQTDIAGRLCAGVTAGDVPEGHRAVRLALERQQAACDVIATLRADAMESAGHAAFEARLAVQQELLTTTLACDAGERDADLCQTAGAMNAAMFEQWRRAVAIYAEIAGEGATGLRGGN